MVSKTAIPALVAALLIPGLLAAQTASPEQKVTQGTSQAQGAAPPSPPKAKEKKVGARFGVEAAEVGQLPGSVSVNPAISNPTAAPGADASAVVAPSGKETEKKRGEFVFAPIPISNPTVGVGAILMGAYVTPLRKDDTVSPPSVFGGAFLYTSNKTWAVAFGTKLYLKRDRFRLLLAGGKGEANYDFYGIGSGAGDSGQSIRINQSGSALLVEFLTHVKWKIFVGPRYQYRNLSAAPPMILPPGFPVPPARELRSQTGALGFRIQQDRRNSTFYPTRGTLADFKADYFADRYASRFNYQSYTWAFNQYIGFTPRQVIAWRFAGCQVTGQVPFYDLCIFGANSDLRGYTAGQYRDRALFATQAEYRLMLPYRLGIAAFAGAGEVAANWGEFTRDNLLPGGGVGVRFNLSKEHHINFRLDYAWGKNGSAVHIAVSEAF